MHPAGHDKVTSVIPCPAWLMKTVAEGEDAKRGSVPALWAAETEDAVVTFSVPNLSGHAILCAHA